MEEAGGIGKKSDSQNVQMFGKQEFCAEEREAIRQLLHQKLGKEHLATRPGAGGTSFTYVESWKVIELANQIFGFNGWSSSVVDITPDYIEESNKGRFTVGVTAVVKVMLKDGTYHEDVGFGMSEHPKKGSAIENAKKEAVSDARKRALRLFGNALGNCLYDKQHLQILKKVNKGAKGFLPEVPVNSFMEKSAKQFNEGPSVNSDSYDMEPTADTTAMKPPAQPLPIKSVNPIRPSGSTYAQPPLPGYNNARANIGNPPNQASQPLSGNTFSQPPQSTEYDEFAFDADVMATFDEVDQMAGQKRTLGEAFPPNPNAEATPQPYAPVDKRMRSL